jgi:hypothetical protein
MITSAAQKAGFGGGLVVDYPNSTKKRKMYLCLMVGQQEIPKGIDGEEATLSEKRRKGEEVKNEKSRKKVGGKKGKKDKLDGKEWILKKKELYRTRGKEGYALCLQDKGVHADGLVFPGTPSSRLEKEGFSSSPIYRRFAHVFHDLHASLTVCQLSNSPQFHQLLQMLQLF